MFDRARWSQLQHDLLDDVAPHARTVGVPGRRTLSELWPPSIANVQRRIAQPGPVAERDVHAAAQQGVAGAAGPLPYLDRIQRLFGRHDVSRVQAHTDGAAAAGASAMGAEAFAMGDHVAFAGAPSLHTAAHEAAHVVQQRGGVQLKGGVGAAGDAYERNADEVADRVVAGVSAADLLDPYAGSSSGPVVQRQIRKPDSAEMFASVDEVISALATAVSPGQREDIERMLQDDQPHALEAVKQRLGARALRDKILDTTRSLADRGRDAYDLDYTPGGLDFLVELVTRIDEWEVLENLVIYTGSHAVTALLPRVQLLWERFAANDDARPTLLECLGDLEAPVSWWSAQLADAVDERAIELVRRFPDGDEAEHALVTKLLKLPADEQGELKAAIIEDKLGLNRKLLKQLLKRDGVQADETLKTLITDQLGPESSDEEHKSDSDEGQGEGQDEPTHKPQTVLPKHTCVRIRHDVKPVPIGTGGSVWYVSVADQLAWIDSKEGEEYVLRLDNGETMDLAPDRFDVVDSPSLAAQSKTSLRPPQGQTQARPVLPEGASGDVTYDQHERWPELQQAFRSLGFEVVCKYNHRKQHVVVRGERNPQNTQGAITKREVRVGKGASSTTYSDLEHEFTHAQQQHGYAIRTGSYKPSKISISQGFTGDQPGLNELSDTEDAYGEVDAYMQEFVRLTGRKEMTTAGEDVSVIMGRVDHHKSKITHYSADTGEAQIPGFRAVVAQYEEAVKAFSSK